jgi:hypothetical protein
MLPFEQLITQSKIARENLRAAIEGLPERSERNPLLRCAVTWNSYLPKIWQSFEAIGRIAKRANRPCTQI